MPYPLKHTDLFRLEKNQGGHSERERERGRGSRDPAVSDCLMKDNPILNPQPHMRGQAAVQAG